MLKSSFIITFPTCLYWALSQGGRNDTTEKCFRLPCAWTSPTCIKSWHLVVWGVGQGVCVGLLFFFPRKTGCWLSKNFWISRLILSFHLFYGWLTVLIENFQSPVAYTGDTNVQYSHLEGGGSYFVVTGPYSWLDANAVRSWGPNNCLLLYPCPY